MPIQITEMLPSNYQCFREMLCSLVSHEQDHGLHDRGAMDLNIAGTTCMRQCLCGSKGWMGNLQLDVSWEGATADIRGNGRSSKWGWKMGHWAYLLWPQPWHRLFSPSLYLFDWTIKTSQGKQLLLRNRWVTAGENRAPLCVHTAKAIRHNFSQSLGPQHTCKLQPLLWTAEFRVIYRECCQDFGEGKRTLVFANANNWPEHALVVYWERGEQGGIQLPRDT